jgi:hypothetical protein
MAFAFGQPQGLRPTIKHVRPVLLFTRKEECSRLILNDFQY